MSKTNFCRLCAHLTNTTNSRKLFERSQQKLLSQVQELTGLQLKNTKALPQLICEKCQEQTLQAHQFRELCIRAQQHFATEEFRLQIKRLPKNIVTRQQRVQNGTGVVVHTEICRIKTEVDEEKKEEAYNLMVMQCTKSEEKQKYELLTNSGDDNTSIKLIYSNEEEVDTLRIEPKNDLYATDIDDKVKPKTNMIRKYQKKYPLNLICDQCGRHFKCRSNFVIHMRRHTGDKPFQCELCPEKFNANWDLKRHVRNHTGELPYPCRYCERRFREISSRVRHERNHTNVRPFACKQCDKSFTQSQYLKNHMLTHTGERAFECKMCNVFFKRKTHLVTHYRSLMHKQNVEKLQSSNTATT